MNLEEIICGKAVPSLPVACQGVECSYSSIACRQVFCNPEITFYETFEEVFQSVIEGKNTYGVVPIENTLAGSVTDNYDLMLEYNLFIAASVTVKIDHCLLALPGTRLEEIRHIYSHPQALHQCSDFFRSHREITPHTYSNTAASAQFVAQQQNPSFGAIGSIACGEKYGLKILTQGLQNRKNNYTRFVVVSKDGAASPLCSRISLILRLAHRPGALVRTLSHFAEKNINLLKLESRPIPDSPFEFLFYCDFAGNIADTNVQLALGQLPQDIIFMKFLGNYPEE